MLKIKVHVEQNAEDNAMLQALYSRSAETVDVHIDRVKKAGSGKFMEQYYVGYGHQSIADCGVTTLYFEGISMLAAKAIQDNSLYNGQESSTRYIDWTHQQFLNPYAENEPGYAETEAAYVAMREFYVDTRPLIEEKLRQEHPMPLDAKERVYNSAISARAFDILRGFLPCGATTNVAWTTTLRNAHDHLTKLFFHPLPEVRQIASKAYDALADAYPHSFKLEAIQKTGRFNYAAAENEYLRRIDHFYSTDTLESSSKSILPKYDTEYITRQISVAGAIPQLGSIGDRPNRAIFPKHLTRMHKPVEISLSIDFGSYRDIQRHRNGYCSMPIVDPTSGFHIWYLDQLPDHLHLQSEAIQLIKAGSWDAQNKDTDLRFQYAQPMGTIVNVDLAYTIPQMVYVGQLRAGNTVHATLRPFAQAMCEALNSLGIQVDYDESLDPWDIRRGEQDILEKKNGEVS